MKRLLFIFLLFPFIVPAQSFKLEIPGYSSKLIARNCYELEPNQYIISITDSDSEDRRFFRLIKIDNLGHVNNISPIVKDSTASIYFMDLQQSKKEWVIQGIYVDKTNERQGVFYYKTDNLGKLDFNLFKKIPIIHGGLRIINSGSIIKDSTLHILGTLDSIETNIPFDQVFGLKININNNEIKQINTNICQGSALSFVINDNKNYVVNGKYNPLLINANFSYVKDLYFSQIGVASDIYIHQWDKSKYLLSGFLIDAAQPKLESNFGAVFLDTLFQYNPAFNSYYISKKDTSSIPAIINSLDWYNPQSIFLGGTFNNSLPPYYLTERPQNTMWTIINLNDKLKPKWIKNFPSNNYSIMHSVLACKDGGVLTVGINYDFDKKSSSIYILKLDEQGLVKTNDTQFNEDIKVFPNPAKDFINISSNILDSELTIYLYDVLGRLITSKTFTNFTTLDITNFNRGIYNYTIKDTNNQIIQANRVIVK